MLHVLFGEIDVETAPIQYIYDIDVMFDYHFKDSWMENEFAHRVVEEIDESKVIAPKIIESPVLGTIIHEWISGGAKQLIMMNSEPNVVYAGNNLGDNCWPLLLELSLNKDIAIDLTYFPEFDWTDNIPVHIINTNCIVNNFRDFLNAHLEIADKEFEFSEIEWNIKIDFNKFE